MFVSQYCLTIFLGFTRMFKPEYKFPLFSNKKIDFTQDYVHIIVKEYCI